ncbi:MAG: hypothetical protein JSR21_05580 [Proteobacteria bacterium]|nr:hypothetical protein [Pseudomonadota bacterium]
MADRAARLLLAGALLPVALALATVPVRTAWADPRPGAAGASAAPVPAPAIGIRAGAHPGFGRIVFDCAKRTGYALTRAGDRLTVRFDDGPAFGAVPAPPRNVRAISAGAGAVEIMLAPGATARASRLGTRIVIDIADPPGASAAAQGAPAPPAGPTSPAPHPVAHPPASPAPAAPTPNAPTPAAPTPAPPPAQPAARVMQAIDLRAAPRAAVLPVRDDAAVFPPPEAQAPSLGQAGSRPPDEPGREVGGAALPAPAEAPASARAAESTPTPPDGPPASTPGVARSVAEADAGEPMAIAVRRLSPAEAGAPGGADAAKDDAILVPFGADVGIAAFRAGATALLVFDERRPLDLAPLRGDPVFGGASVKLLAAGTLLALPLPTGTRVVVARTRGAEGAGGWAVRLARPEPGPGAAGPEAPSIHPDLSDGRLLLPAAAPGQTVALADPEDGATLLVGTLRGREGGPPPQAVVSVRRAPGYVLRPSWAGIVLEPLSDALALHPVENGFALALGAAAGPDGKDAGAGESAAADDNPAGPRGALGSPGGAAAAAALADAATLSRRYDFPPLPAGALLRRLREQTAGAAAAPPLGRGEQRRAVAQTMIALGMGAEAQGVLADAMADDPKLAADPDTAGLAAIAALVAGRTAQAAAIDDPRLDGTDEITLWRAVRMAQLSEGSPAAAASFAVTLRLALSYPPGLAAHVVPLALETMASGGEAAAAAPVLAARKDDPRLALARAELAAARGETDAALAGYDALAAGHDRLARARALLLAVNLRLSAGKITPAEAAAQLDRMIAAWHGDWRERAVRERLAQVQAQAGAWGAALATLREAEAAFPEDAAAIHAELAATFARMLRRKADETLPPLELVALLDQNADLVPDGPVGADIARLLADRLSALDLPQQAGALLDRLMRAARRPATRADLGATLAELRLRDGDPQAALAALTASAPPPPASPPDPAPPVSLPSSSPPQDAAAPASVAPATAASPSAAPPVPAADDPVSPALRVRRALLTAQARARAGDPAGARAALDGIDTPEAQRERAAIAEQAHDFAAAAAALAANARAALPASGPLTEGQQRALLRWATDASQANDPAALGAVRDFAGKRMQDGPLGAMFGLLVADPARGVQDLPRAAQETKLARALPEQLKALEAPQAASAR